MLTFASQLHTNVGSEERIVSAKEQLVPDENQQTTERDTWIAVDERVLNVAGRYQLFLAATDSGWIPGFDRLSQLNLDCHIHPTNHFVGLAPLITLPIEGIRQPFDICGLGNEVTVLYPKAHGAIHGYLKHRKKLSEVEAARYYQKIINIIANAHKSGVVLRDLKLKKFIFTDSSRLQICLSDLEDAFMISGQGLGNDLLDDRHGCPAYVAPEMLHPGSYSGRAADMWSAGVILYTLLVGHYPFFDVNPQNLFTKIRSGHYHIPENISYLARSLICSLLSYEPGLRPSAEAVMDHPWMTHPPTSIETTLHHKHMGVDQTVPTHKLL